MLDTEGDWMDDLRAGVKVMIVKAYVANNKIIHSKAERKQDLGPIPAHTY